MTINRENVGLLADFIELHEELPFDMFWNQVPDQCGTAGCVAAFGAALWPQAMVPAPLSGKAMASASHVAEILGISVKQREKLFYPGDDHFFGDEDDKGTHHAWEDKGGEIQYPQVSRAGAVKTLRRLAETGEVKWFFADQKEV